jgi:peroxiredoxin (alkyl hydroperoxide reductase subunit C)
MATTYASQPETQVALNLTAPPARLELNGPAPDFEANTTFGPIRFSQWQPGKWVILFSHPADFTPVCTTEFIEFAKRSDEFDRRNVALLGNSIDSIYSHIAWMRNIEEKFGVPIRFPVIADLDQKVSTLYGMVHKASAQTATVRCVYIIDPKRMVRAMIYYPLNVGRNINEVVRVVDALQTADKHSIACPANWVPGDDVIVPPPTTSADAAERASHRGYQVTDWFFSKRKL